MKLARGTEFAEQVTLFGHQSRSRSAGRPRRSALSAGPRRSGQPGLHSYRPLSAALRAALPLSIDKVDKTARMVDNDGA